MKGMHHVQPPIQLHVFPGLNSIVGGRSATPDAVGTMVGWTRTVLPTSQLHHPVEPLPAPSLDAKGRVFNNCLA